MITIQAVTYKHMPHKLTCFMHNVLAQSDNNWKLIVGHDGPSEDGTKEYMTRTISGRLESIFYIESPKRENCWGHNLRADMLAMINTPYVWFTNCDNLMVYDAISILNEACRSGNWDVIYFPIAHSHYGYEYFKRSFAYSAADMCQFIVKTELAQKVGFNDRGFAADGVFIEQLKGTYPNLKILELKSILAIHH